MIEVNNDRHRHLLAAVENLELLDDLLQEGRGKTSGVARTVLNRVRQNVENVLSFYEERPANFSSGQPIDLSGTVEDIEEPKPARKKSA